MTRRADRLFQILQILRRRRVVTAARLAEELGVSERTVYRDVRDLLLAGVPIQSEAGVGYALPRGLDLPPLMFTEEEVEALVLGARIVESWADPALARAAQDVLAKVEAVLPDRLRHRVGRSALFAPPSSDDPPLGALGDLRRAIRGSRKVRFAYTRADGQGSARTVRPLCLVFFAPTWMLAAYCELRSAFRNFRLDRMRELEVLDETFVDEPGRTLADYLASVEERD